MIMVYYFSYKTNKFSMDLYQSGLFMRKDECEKARVRLKDAGFFVTAIHEKGE